MGTVKNGRETESGKGGRRRTATPRMITRGLHLAIYEATKNMLKEAQLPRHSLWKENRTKYLHMKWHFSF
eukprot:2426017-Pyramimonas_sp.AAC.1